ncbi:MAG TPA: GNAT family N-acetyltransferase [Roseiflexaceae bacterium]|nr:GNAT family N-acetyltransferase [Roseiflexaceae bacterium]
MSLIDRLQAYYNTIAASQPDRSAPVVKPLPPTDPTITLTAEFLRTAIFACTPATFHPAARVPGLQFIVLSDQSTIAEIQEGLDANALGFDPAAAPATEAEATAFRAELIASRAFTAKLDGQPVAAGMFTPPIRGIAELAGITTLAPYRGRGIGAAVTSEIARVAFAHGIDTAILRTDNPIAYRIYQRIGFYPAAILEERP